MITARMMLRQCGFSTRDGKYYTKKLHDTYYLSAKIYTTKSGMKRIIVSKYNRGTQISRKEFIEDVDYENMLRYSSTLTF